MSATNPKKSFRARVGTAVRRSSSFLVPARPSTPPVRSASEDLTTSAAGSPAKPSPLSSKPASIRSVERPPPVSLVAPEDIMPQEKPEKQEREPSVAENPAPPAKADPAPSEPVSEPQTEPVAPEAPPVEESKPVREPEVSSTSEALEAERHEETQPAPEPEHHVEPARIPVSVSESPKSLSRAASRESLAQSDHTHPSEHVQFAAMESPKATPKQLSVKTSRENLGQDQLSPIPEDERSAIEERNMLLANQGAAPPLPPSTLFAPVMGTKLSEASDGTTPRALPPPVAPAHVEQQPAADEKGKEREQNGSAVPVYEGLPLDGYFASSASIPGPPYYAEDPFRDPDPLLASDVHYSGMPEPVIPESLEQRAAAQPSMPVPFIDSMPVAYPLPPLSEVTSRNLRTVPSDYTLAAHSSRAPSVHHGVETDETLPLLSRRKNATTDTVNSAWDHRHSYQNQGWNAYALPDTTTYYSHPGMRITTDIDLLNLRKFDALAGYIGKKITGDERSVLPEGWETWLHDDGTAREDFVLARCWINHGARALGFWPPPVDGANELATMAADDRLDSEYRYWAFMESHPAHIPLPANAYSEALDALTWSYTDRLLKTNRRAPPPFTQHESHELIEVLRSTSGSESPMQAAVQTKIVARILRRIVQWKQHFFRPQKPLPRGVTNEGSPRSSGGVPYRRTCLDFALAWLCFGIPYLFANRHGHQRYDEEGGLMRSAGPMLVVGASVCIVAAIMLTASATFLALPGLDHIARTAGFISILGSIASLGSSVIAAFRNQVEVQRMAARGGEGLVVTMSTISGGSILPSLPAVFLAWSIVSFVTGIVLYAFRGTVVMDPSHWARFASYTRWTTVGVLGFFGGVLIASMFAVRR